MNDSKVAKFAAFTLLAFLHCIAAWSQTYPSRAVRIIVPFGPGGTTDLVSRTIGQQLSDLWGQQVVIDNRVGAAGNLGAGVAAHARPDGYTLFIPGISFAINPGLYKNIPYDAVKDFLPITQVAQTPCMLVLNPGVAIGSVKDLIAFAKANPGQLNYGSAGAGGSTHIAPALLESMTGIKMTHVPYRGVAESYVDLIAGRVQLMIDSQPTAMPQIKSGKVKAIAVTSIKRAIAMPDLPTLAESGVPGYEMASWYGAFAPAGTPPDIMKKLVADFVSVIRKPDVSARLLSQGAEPVASTPEHFAHFLQVELKKWADVVKAAGIIVD